MDDAKNKQKKTILIAVVALLLLIVIGVAVYFLFFREKKPTIITVNNATTYPSFSDNVTSYVIYTTEDSLSFTCSGEGKIVGCDASVPLNAGGQSRAITIKDTTYNFAIMKLAKSDSTIKIKSVRGNPTAWTNSATLTVNVENSGEVKILEYSFDGGKSWHDSNTATITKNGVYKVQVRDYFGFLSNVESVTVTRVDAEPPIVDISKEINETDNPEDQRAVLTAVATDSISGVVGYEWNTGDTTPEIVVKEAGDYTVKATDRAGNVAKKTLRVSFGAEETIP